MTLTKKKLNQMKNQVRKYLKYKIQKINKVFFSYLETVDEKRIRLAKKMIKDIKLKAVQKDDFFK